MRVSARVRCVSPRAVQAVGMGGLARPGSRGVGLSQSERATGVMRGVPLQHMRGFGCSIASATLSLCPASLFQRQPLKVGLFLKQEKNGMCAMQSLYFCYSYFL